jgi:hypothetical protein
MAKTPKKRHWTVLVYLAGDNNLDSAGVVDLGEMKKVGSDDRIAVVAQFDRSGDKVATRRYFLRKGTPLAKDVVKSLGETDTGDPAVLKDFATWAITNYPAEHYMLVIWNHGAGWDDSNLYEGDYFGGATPPVVRKGVVIKKGRAGAAARAPVRMGTVRAAAKRARRALFGSTVESMVASRAIAFDDQAKDFLDNMELKRVLEDIRRAVRHKIDIVGFDACLMSMVEVAYQIRDSVGVTCGSEEEEPNEGWPYDAILKALASTPAMTPRQLAGTIVKQYLASYKANDGVTLAATDLAQIAPLADAVGALGKALSSAMSDGPARSAIIAVRAQVQEYSSPYDEYCDLGDLCDLLARGVGNPAVGAACGRVRAALKNAVIEAGAKGKAVANSNGISIYFPKKQVCRLYDNLDFAKTNAWAAFVKQYTDGVSRRD